MEISKKDMKILLKSQQGELDAVKNYAPVAEKFPEVESVKNDEKRHGDTVKGLLNKEQD